MSIWPWALVFYNDQYLFLFYAARCHHCVPEIFGVCACFCDCLSASTLNSHRSKRAWMTAERRNVISDHGCVSVSVCVADVYMYAALFVLLGSYWCTRFHSVLHLVVFWQQSQAWVIFLDVILTVRYKNQFFFCFMLCLRLLCTLNVRRVHLLLEPPLRLYVELTGEQCVCQCCAVNINVKLSVRTEAVLCRCCACLLVLCICFICGGVGVLVAA